MNKTSKTIYKVRFIFIRIELKTENIAIGIPHAAAVAIHFLIGLPWDFIYGVVIVPPPIPNIELNRPVKKENDRIYLNFFSTFIFFSSDKKISKEINIKNKP